MYCLDDWVRMWYRHFHGYGHMFFNGYRDLFLYGVRYRHFLDNSDGFHVIFMAVGLVAATLVLIISVVFR